MKVIKIILGIIIALTVVFLATGLVVKETKYTAEIEVNKPIEEVFALFDNPEALKDWMPEVQSIKPIEVRAGKIGSSYKMLIESQGQTMEMTEKIMSHVLNEKMTFQFDSDQMIKTDDFNFIANGNKTKIVQHCTVEAKSYIMSCMFPYFKSALQTQSVSYMNRFKELAEK
ncbi:MULTISPECIES: SRPBCC family protein [Tenacibaculum]|uniref:SRPBCC family protein n=1 Tax=Tenacibaculum TaxID=104267 RepID=UPI001F0AFFC7|nr:MULTISPECIES: SRPBCC family protein [Tenacibaculum]MCH3883091.1 SRPBCC family protein [Tenacibaculum aquimarinum]MCH3884736.1 SRPBCC family protein [Tenacibaculum aquimarinum]MDO6600586.1 SRPBCC family protein [Tenacibaculum sp. 1_MG-2023]